jgi:hypothetical protein
MLFHDLNAVLNISLIHVLEDISWDGNGQIQRKFNGPKSNKAGIDENIQVIKK